MFAPAVLIAHAAGVEPGSAAPWTIAFVVFRLLHALFYISDIDKALTRIDDGEYGRCTRCGKQIKESRLQAVPAAELCITCKEWEETS